MLESHSKTERQSPIQPEEFKIEVKFDKTLLGKVLGDRTNLTCIVQADGAGSKIVVDAYPLDAVGRKLMFGARPGVTQTVVTWFVAHLENNLAGCLQQDSDSNQEPGRCLEAPSEPVKAIEPERQTEATCDPTPKQSVEATQPTVGSDTPCNSSFVRLAVVKRRSSTLKQLKADATRIKAKGL